MIRVLAIGLWLMISSSDVYAFPEMVRHSYQNCTSCHVSPGGGGLLTPYGRSLSRELLSQAPREESSEGEFLYGTVRLPEWLNLGGQGRLLQMVQDTTQAFEARFVVMQVDLEAAAKVSRFTALATLGRQDPVSGGQVQWSDFLISRRHWLQAQLLPEDREEALSLRAGRFYPVFGLMNPDHLWATRFGLGFGPGAESYNVEAMWTQASAAGTLTAITGRLDRPASEREWGVAADLSLALGDNSRIGFSGKTSKPYGQGEQSRKTAVGVHALTSFSTHLYGLNEVDGLIHGDGGTGLAQASKFGWEFTQGVHLYAVEDFLRTRWGDDLAPAFFDLAGGLLYYPRPHFELSAQVGVQFTPYSAGRANPVGWLQLHFWL